VFVQSNPHYFSIYLQWKKLVCGNTNLMLIVQIKIIQKVFCQYIYINWIRPGGSFKPWIKLTHTQTDRDEKITWLNKKKLTAISLLACKKNHNLIDFIETFWFHNFDVASSHIWILLLRNGLGCKFAQWWITDSSSSST